MRSLFQKGVILLSLFFVIQVHAGGALKERDLDDEVHEFDGELFHRPLSSDTEEGERSAAQSAILPSRTATPIARLRAMTVASDEEHSDEEFKLRRCHSACELGDLDTDESSTPGEGQLHASDSLDMPEFVDEAYRTPRRKVGLGPRRIHAASDEKASRHRHHKTQKQRDKEYRRRLKERSEGFLDRIHKQQRKALELKREQESAEVAVERVRNQQMIRCQRLLDQKIFLEGKLHEVEANIIKVNEFFRVGVRYAEGDETLAKQLRQRDALLQLRRMKMGYESDILKIEEDLIALQTVLQLPEADLRRKYHKRAKIVFALSGGGIRGLLEVVYLKLLLQEIRSEAKRLNFPQADTLEFHQLIDVVAGTSTGSFIASAISLGIPLEKVEQLYLNGGRVFQRKWLSLWGLFGPKYRNDDKSNLFKLLSEMLSDKDGTPIPLAEAKVATIIPSHLVKEGKPHYYNSVEAAAKERCGVTFVDACRASAAAPLYFSSLKLPSMDGIMREHSDGGVAGCNNPSLVALTQTMYMYRRILEEDITSHNVIMFSLGSGQAVDDSASVEGKGVSVASHVISGLMSGSSNMIHDAEQELLLDGRYFPVDFKISAKHAGLDSYGSSSLEHFQNVARRTYAENREKNQRLIEMVLGIYRDRLDEQAMKEEMERVLAMADETPTEPMESTSAMFDTPLQAAAIERQHSSGSAAENGTYLDLPTVMPAASSSHEADEVVSPLAVKPELLDDPRLRRSRHFSDEMLRRLASDREQDREMVRTPRAAELVALMEERPNAEEEEHKNKLRAGMNWAQIRHAVATKGGLQAAVKSRRRSLESPVGVGLMRTYRTHQ